MRKIVAGFAISLDGYIEGPTGEYDWIVMDPEFDFTGHMKRFDSFFFGRIAYEKLLAEGNTSFPGIKNYVFSNSITAVDKNFTLLKGDTRDLVSAIKKQEGKDIAVYGGANLLSSLLDLDLVDELMMSVIPIVLGQGKPMAGLIKQRVYLKLVETKRFSSGTVQLTYQVNK
ncbi:MAG TPA: dihydrofolate reductase family protein [Chitinophagaceae bacterium]|nr:dihydrofolate reductase family protein [Chitinophagaceae bacterium]